MIHMAICDDEAVAASIIQKKIEQRLAEAGVEYQLHIYTDSLELRNDILSGLHAQVLFLDIDMPRLDGILLGERLREAGFSGLVIFITSRSEKVFDSFRVQPFRFIRKSKFSEEIGIVIRDILAELRPKEEQTLVFSRSSEIVRVNPQDILYVESQRKLQYLHTLQGTITVNSGMEEICQQLAGHGFIRTHKSYMVNYRFIYSITKTDIILDNKEILPVSRQRVKEVKLAFQELSLHS